jgi:hypothetical protein
MIDQTGTEAARLYSTEFQRDLLEIFSQPTVLETFVTELE